MLYRVNDLYPCIQGEGAKTGVPMVMVRLQGCPVACHFCDTKETWALHEADQSIELDDAVGVNPRWAAVHVNRLTRRIMELAGPRDGSVRTFHGRSGIQWVLVSGGEPLVQDLSALTQQLRNYDMQRAVETSGTELVTGIWSWITVSPKVGNPGGRAIQPSTVHLADEIKWVVGKREDIERLCEFLDQYPTKSAVEIALQPMSLSPAATDLCLEAALRHGWRLSIQTHKLLHADWKERSV